MEDVIKGCKNHQHQDDREPNPEAEFLGALGQRPSANRLNDIEQKVAAIEQRDRKQVQKPDRDRKNGRQVEKRRKTGCCDLS